MDSIIIIIIIIIIKYWRATFDSNLNCISLTNALRTGQRLPFAGRLLPPFGPHRLPYAPYTEMPMQRIWKKTIAKSEEWNRLTTASLSWSLTEGGKL